jgi:hypothetical protein
MLTLLIVAVVAVDAVVMVVLLRRWRRSAVVEARPDQVRTPIDHDPDNRYPFMSGDSW